MSPEDFTRLTNNFYNSKGIDYPLNQINTEIELTNYLSQNLQLLEKKYRVAFLFICLNPLYWEFAPAMVNGAKQLFLPGHKTDFLFFTDIPNDNLKVHQGVVASFQSVVEQKKAQGVDASSHYNRIPEIVNQIIALRQREDVKLKEIPPMDWPYPTLMRYHIFLQQEEVLKNYDYIFYCDVDMRFEGIVGDEILGNGLTAAPHPGYAINKRFWPPYEPNVDSASYIKRPGRLIQDSDSATPTKLRFQPEYYAGGFQGGKSDVYLGAMKECRKLIDADLAKGYIPIWNDETAWNKYLSENPPEIMLTLSYIYPDSLVKEYYELFWGRSYQPKLVTLTKWFSTSPQNMSQFVK